MTPKQTAKLEQKVSEWKKGYEAGASSTLRQNDVALKIGRAILSALDERYEPIEEDY